MFFSNLMLTTNVILLIYFYVAMLLTLQQEPKYLDAMLNSHWKFSIEVSRLTQKFYAPANMLLRNFKYCSVDVKCMLFRSYCTSM